jgi:DNA polymerase
MEDLKAHLEFFAELGVAGVRREPEWRAREAAATFVEANSADDVRRAGLIGPAEEVETVSVFASQAEALAAIRNDLGDCTRCKLHALGRKQIVYGVGNPNADLMFVGEAPGADEDIQGEPFVGRAGQLLTKIIEAIGLTRADVYIANVIK